MSARVKKSKQIKKPSIPVLPAEMKSHLPDLDAFAAKGCAVMASCVPALIEERAVGFDIPAKDQKIIALRTCMQCGRVCPAIPRIVVAENATPFALPFCYAPGNALDTCFRAYIFNQSLSLYTTDSKKVAYAISVCNFLTSAEKWARIKELLIVDYAEKYKDLETAAAIEYFAQKLASRPAAVEVPVPAPAQIEEVQ